MELTGLTPGELLQLDAEELAFATSLANNLEEWRWDNWQKLFGN